MIKPIGMYLYVNRKYRIDSSVVLEGEPIKQKWNGIAQHFASFVLSHTDVVVLTFFSTFKNVSIYNIYYMVVAGVRQIITTAMTGVEALFGNLYVKKDSQLQLIFNGYELLIHSLVILVFSVTALLICPFISIYTRGINDANYIYPNFGILMAMAYGAYSLRLPYNTMVMAAGHYKQTQNSAIVEAVLNVLISFLLVKFIGLYGVAIGTLIAMLYRTVYLAYYLSKAILCRKFELFVKHVVIDVALIVAIYVSCRSLVYYPVGYYEWILLAIKVFGIALFEVIISNFLFYRIESKELLRLLLTKINHNK
jgi:O-antigen/teichoic acid export membrane protein